MAIYKPSNLSPDLKEIDLEMQVGQDGWKNNIFEAQVNTSGENILAYKLLFYENNKEEKIFETPAVELKNKNTGKFIKDGIVNKGIVKTYYGNDDDINPVINTNSSLPHLTTTPSNFIVNNQLNGMPTIDSTAYTNMSLKNGKDYQWSIRTYNAPIGSTSQPNTKVCSGFLVGSTANVIWTGYDPDNFTELANFRENIEPELLYDRYIQLPAPKKGSNIYPSKPNYTEATGATTDIERIKIDWIEKNLGLEKNFTKIELVDSMKYDYIDGTEFDIYICDNQHTLNSVYADPNSLLTQTYILCLCNSLSVTSSLPSTITNVTDITNPSGLPSGAVACRRIIGISNTTGEIRLETPLNKVPNDTYYYALYEYNRNDQKMTIVPGQTYSKQKLGGISVIKGKIISNRWDGTAKRLFIQPNINIKSDDTNPNELVFSENGVRMDIKKYSTKNNSNPEDWTFDKLDNTQWVLSGTQRLAPFTSTGSVITTNSVMTARGNAVLVAPGSEYTVYTDFMDSAPNGIFYARKTPEITIYFKNLNPDITSQDYVTVSSTQATTVPWRDIAFITEWSSKNGIQVKYYRYTLYDNKGEIIEQSQDTYNSDLEWYFRGFLPKETYTIEIFIEDELNKEFIVTETFNVDYETKPAEAPLEVQYICDKQAFKVRAETPLYVIQTDLENDDGTTTPCVDMEDINPYEDYVEIPDNKVMNYTTVLAEGYPNVAIVKPMSFITQFRLRESFIRSIPDGGEKTICEIGMYKGETKEDGYDTYKLTISSFLTFFINEETNTIVQNNNRLRMKWYKNTDTEPLMCFNNGTASFYDIVAEDSSQEIQLPESLAYALQNNVATTSSGSTYNIYYFVTTLPNSGYTTRQYVLTEDCVLNGKLYSRGIYKYNATTKWTLVTDKQYIFAETLSQVPGYNMDTFSVPQNCRYTDNNIIMYTDTNNVWLDDFNVAIEASINSLKEKWFMAYLTIDNRNDTDVNRAYIQMNSERIVGER